MGGFMHQAPRCDACADADTFCFCLLLRRDRVRVLMEGVSVHVLVCAHRRMRVCRGHVACQVLPRIGRL
jgi:hypothetical protein